MIEFTLLEFLTVWVIGNTASAAVGWFACVFYLKFTSPKKEIENSDDEDLRRGTKRVR